MLLAVVEQTHRGATETQFADVFYVARELHRQLGRVDVVLRGAAVDAAVRRTAPVPETAGVPAPDPAASVTALLEDGIRVYAATADLARQGLADSPLLAGVREGEPEWDRYERVWFL